MIRRMHTAMLTPLLALFLLMLGMSAQAASRVEIDAKVRGAVDLFYKKVPGGKELAQRAAGMLVFPEVLKGGMFIGAEYGEGALLVNNRTKGYYSLASASFGFQFGVEEKTIVLLFMTRESLDKFLNSEGWQVGVDGSVAIAEFGAGKSLDSNTLQEPIIGFVVANKGLMAGISLEGSKITRINK
ncbi:YSC84-related protein [Hahella sp. SMD15-11]|uniref:YSC84-related protein n=1 Tax=Thermohahella caldifontis TaxID=3142973 RepID=A0AB39UXP4_9GAMM